MIEFIQRLNPSISICVAEDWMWETEAYPDEEKYVTRAVEKRKREFRAGRHSAHRALEQLGHMDFSVNVGEQRQPLWPTDVIGSISHTEGFCACVALKTNSEIEGIGIDVEALKPVDKASLPLICNRKELSFIDEMQPATPAPLCKLIFSAKECVHKVYYPINGHTLDFLDAEISIDIDTKTFEALITNPEKQPRSPIKKLKGHFDFDDSYLYTVILKEWN